MEEAHYFERATTGPATLFRPAERMQLAHAVLGARSAGHEVVLVHGGGDQIRALTRRLGLLVGAARDVLRFLPPYVITATDVERALELVRQGLRDVSQP